MYAQAHREFSTAIKLMPERVSAYNELGYVHIALKEWDEAKASFTAALKQDSGSDDGLAGLGLAFYGQGDLDAALPQLENAFISAEPRIEVILALAEIHEKKGDFQKAIRLNKLAVSRLMAEFNQRWK